MLNMKLKERLALALSAFLILFTLMLIVDLQMDYGISGHRVPLHGRVKIGDDSDKGHSAYIEFRKRFLHRSNGSNSSREFEQSAPSETSGLDAEPKTPTPPADRFEDLQRILIQQLKGKADDNMVVIPPHKDLNVLRPENPTIGEMEDLEPRYCRIAQISAIVLLVEFKQFLRYTIVQWFTSGSKVRNPETTKLFSTNMIALAAVEITIADTEF
ncbi:unnamed protein product [Pieris macdunnoughi]|nr:unnamed protein product [Pieris macdunnoughi]